MAIEFQNIQIIRSGVRTGAPYQFLGDIATYLRNYLSEFRNPNFYAYRLDGNGYYINDGGFDMYDNPGNVTTPWLKNNISKTGLNGAWSLAAYPSASNYWQTSSVATLDGDFQYISLAYRQYGPTSQSISVLPLTVIGSRLGNGSTGYQTAGNSGADGGGTLATGSIYNGNLVDGFTAHAFYRQTYNATASGQVDPSHCSVYLLLGHSNWASSFGTVRTFSDTISSGQAGGALYSSGSQTANLLTACILLSKATASQVTEPEIKTVVDNFIFRVKSSLNY